MALNLSYAHATQALAAQRWVFYEDFTVWRSAQLRNSCNPECRTTFWNREISAATARLCD